MFCVLRVVTVQVSCDLLAEMIKFNPPLCVRLHQCLAEQSGGLERFTTVLSGNIVNASVLVHVLCLTSSELSCPPRSWVAGLQTAQAARQLTKAHQRTGACTINRPLITMHD